MATKYVLHGGEAQKIDSRNDVFFSEILADYPKSARVLLVQFAVVDEKKEIYRERDRSQFERVRGERNIVYETATEADFINQIKQAEVIYFCGGTTPKLINTLKQFKQLKQVFAGKTVAGESAGANCLAGFCFSKSGGGVIPGLGLVPVKIIPHFKPGDEFKFDNVYPEVENVFLAEYEYKVVVV